MKTNLKQNEMSWGLVQQVFWQITAYPKTFIGMGLIFILSTAIYIPNLVKDTRSDAFLPEDEPALLYRNKVKQIFGLTDPMVIAVVNHSDQGIFNPKSLALVNWLTEEIKKLEHIDPDQVSSLATENNISGNHDGMQVDPFWQQLPNTQQEADKIRAAVMDFPLYLGSMVAKDGSATLIVAEVTDSNQAQNLYQQLLDLAKRAPNNSSEQIHVAGEGATSGYLGAYIDADAQRLNPLAALIISSILFLAFRTLRGILLPNVVVLATVASALGLMAFSEVKFFVITNGLLPVLIGIAVADSIHIFNQYYEDMAAYPDISGRELVIKTMEHMWRPISMTTITTQAGFFGLYLASVMPPMKYFGLFAMVGVGAAWVFSMLIVPAWLSLLKPKPSSAYTGSMAKADIFGRLLEHFGRWILSYPYLILASASIALILGIYGTTQLELNEERIRTFQKDEPIVIADNTINQVFDGVHYLDIFVQTANNEDIFIPANLEKIAALQGYVESLPHVNGSISVVDYLKQMNRSLNNGHISAYTLPQNQDLIAQYFLLYSASGDPSDFEEEVDYDYRLANIRVSLDSGKYSHEKIVIEKTQAYLDKYFNDDSIKANLSGRVNVDYHWIKRLGETNWASLALALFLVWIMAAISFRSIIGGLVTLLPVSITVLMVYAVMACNGIWLSISTSMFAAIAIGLGVDFSVHTLERIQSSLKQQAQDLDAAIIQVFPSTGRALLFNFLALSLGFGVLVSSKVVVLQEFGAIVALAVLVSFIASLSLLPALIKVFKPSFLGFNSQNLKHPTALNTESNLNLDKQNA